MSLKQLGLSPALVCWRRLVGSRFDQFGNRPPQPRIRYSGIGREDSQFVSAGKQPEGRFGVRCRVILGLEQFAYRDTQHGRTAAIRDSRLAPIRLVPFSYF